MATAVPSPGVHGFAVEWRRAPAAPAEPAHAYDEKPVATVVWGIEGLVGLDSYAPADERTPRYRKDARGHALNAVMVEQWHGTAWPAGHETAFLTNLPVQDALRVFV